MPTYKFAVDELITRCGECPLCDYGQTITDADICALLMNPISTLVIDANCPLEIERGDE